MADKTCSICIEKFTKAASRKKAACPYCDISACVGCTQTYLIGSYEDPHCMGCRKGWSREVLDSFALITWIEGDYKKHRQNILLDREKSRLPAAQLIIERIKESEERRPILEVLQKEVNRAYIIYRDALKVKEDENMRIINLSRGLAPDGMANSKEEKRVFIMPCPAVSCRGFLSTAYKCGVCDIFVCPDCREIKGIAKDSDHVCDPNTVATVAAVKKECKNCPECGTSIFRILGCPQMFCTQCHTPFDWNTGRKITTGAIHNPHYFDYIKQLNGGVMPRQPGDIPCGNLPGAWEIDRRLRLLAPEFAGERQIIYQACNTFNHLQHYEIRNLTTGAEDTDNTEYNLKYIRGLITELRWKQVLQQKEKRRMRKDEQRQRIEAICGAASDIFGQYMTLMNNLPITQEHKTATTSLYTMLYTLKDMFNKEMLVLSYRYKCLVLTITDDYTTIKIKASRTKPGHESSDDTDEESVSSNVKKKSKKNVVVKT